MPPPPPQENHPVLLGWFEVFPSEVSKVLQLKPDLEVGLNPPLPDQVLHSYPRINSPIGPLRTHP